MSTRKQYSPHCYDNFFVLFAKLLDYFKDAITTEENLSFQFFLVCVCLIFCHLVIIRVTGFSPSLLVIVFFCIYYTRQHCFIVYPKQHLPHSYSACLCDKSLRTNIAYYSTQN